MKVMLGQVNPTVGDLRGNALIIQEQMRIALQNKYDVLVLPELVTVGYPPRDLLYSRRLWDNHPKVIDQLWDFLRSHPQQLTVIFGGLHEQILSGGRTARYNAAWILDRCYGRRVVHKRLLPCYDVFDETRYFTSAVNEPCVPLPIRVSDGTHKEYDVLCDILICEDIWNFGFNNDNADWLPSTYTVDPVSELKATGPLFVLNGSPFWRGKIKQTKNLIESICRKIERPVVWCNQVGAHDDIVTGGYSMVSIPVHDPNQPPATLMAEAFQVDQIGVQLADGVCPHSNFNPGGNPSDVKTGMIRPSISGRVVDPNDFDNWTILKALCLHMADYKRRCGFKQAVLGLSGGIDSAVVAFIAAAVFGSENVTAIGMPSPHSSEGSVTDAEELAKNLKIHFQIKRIDEVYEAVRKLFLSGGMQKFSNSVTDENIQPRARAMILMAFSNDNDPCLLLTTGNKSEITIGYCTIYGDMCGGLAVISDLPKTQVYSFALFINKYYGKVIPVNTIEKPASAELRPDQKDTDSLPPYNILDPLLYRFVNDDAMPDEIKAEMVRTIMSKSGKLLDDAGDLDIELRVVDEMYRRYRNSEYKRQQMPPGPKIQRRSFGSGRRMPIAMKFTTVD